MKKLIIISLIAITGFLGIFFFLDDDSVGAWLIQMENNKPKVEKKEEPKKKVIDLRTKKTVSQQLNPNVPTTMVTSAEYDAMNWIQKKDYVENICKQLLGGWDANAMRNWLGTGDYRKGAQWDYTFLHYLYMIPSAIVQEIEFGVSSAICVEHSTSEAGWIFAPGTNERVDRFGPNNHNYFGCHYSEKNKWMQTYVYANAKDEAGSDKVTRSKWAKFEDPVHSALNWGDMLTNERYSKFGFKEMKNCDEFGWKIYESGYGGGDDKNAWRKYNDQHKSNFDKNNLGRINDLAQAVKMEISKQQAQTDPNQFVVTGGTVNPNEEWVPSGNSQEEWGYFYDVSKGVYVSESGMRMHPVYHKPMLHSGIDVNCGAGTDIFVAKSGRVELVGYQSARGKQIVVDHGGGWYSRYQHLSEQLVKEGDQVRQGQLIAKSGATGVGTGAHLHFEIMKDGIGQSYYKHPEDYYDMTKGHKVKMKNGMSYEDYMNTVKSGQTVSGSGGATSGGVQAQTVGATTTPQSLPYMPQQPNSYASNSGQIHFNPQGVEGIIMINGTSSPSSTPAGTTPQSNSTAPMPQSNSADLQTMRQLSGSGSTSDPRTTYNKPDYGWIKEYDINTANLSDQRLAVLSEGTKELGKPYRLQKPDVPNEFNCSQFTSWCYTRALGYTYTECPAFSGSQRGMSVAKKVSLDEAKPGDIVWMEGHVMLFLKKVNDKRIVVMESTSNNYCKGTGSGVSSRPINKPFEYYRADRFPD